MPTGREARDAAKRLAWLAERFPVDYEEGIRDAHADAGTVEAHSEEYAKVRSAQRYAIGMVRNAAYWAGYAKGVAADETTTTR